MELGEILAPSAVKVLSRATSKKRLMQELADLVEEAYGLPASQVLDAMLERESLGPTGVGGGVALPHARIEGLDRVLGAFLLLDAPIEFESVDRQPVDVIFGLFAPEEAGVEHLKALALVSRTLREPSVLAKIRANPSAAKLHAILTDAQGTRAA